MKPLNDTQVLIIFLSVACKEIIKCSGEKKKHDFCPYKESFFESKYSFNLHGKKNQNKLTIYLGYLLSLLIDLNHKAFTLQIQWTFWTTMPKIGIPSVLD